MYTLDTTSMTDRTTLARYSGPALCCYDFFLCFPREARYMWKSRPTLGSLLYFTLRYPMLFNVIAVLFAYMPRNGQQSQLVSTEPSHTSYLTVSCQR